MDNHAGTAVVLWPADLPHKWYLRLRELKRLKRILHVPINDMLKGIAARKGDPLTPVIVKEPVGSRRSATSRNIRTSSAGSVSRTLSYATIRTAPMAAQLLGYVSEVSKQELKQRPSGVRRRRQGRPGRRSSRPSTRTSGALPGTTDLRVDSLGRPLGPRRRKPPNIPGSAVRLTLDMRLQRAAQHALAYGMQLARDSNCYGCWDANGGAIVALDPHDGSVLALASAPTYNPGVYSGRVDHEGARERGSDRRNARERRTTRR